MVKRLKTMMTVLRRSLFIRFMFCFDPFIDEPVFNFVLLRHGVDIVSAHVTMKGIPHTKSAYTKAWAYLK